MDKIIYTVKGATSIDNTGSTAMPQFVNWKCTQYIDHSINNKSLHKQLHTHTNMYTTTLAGVNIYINIYVLLNDIVDIWCEVSRFTVVNDMVIMVVKVHDSVG